jgi:hypothetical protein
LHLVFQQCDQTLSIEGLLRRRFGLDLAHARVRHASRQSNLVDRLADGRRRDAVIPVVRFLARAPAIHLLDRPLHRACHSVGIEHGATLLVPRRAADGLDERPVGAKESLLICIQDGHQSYFREIQPFAKQVDPHEHVELAEPKPPDDLHPLDGIDIGVHVAHPDTHLLEVISEIFRHSLRERGYKHPRSRRLAGSDLCEEIVDLSPNGTDLHGGIDEPGGPNDLLHDHATRQLQLHVARGRRHEQHPRCERHELSEIEGPIVERRGQPEPELHQSELS